MNLHGLDINLAVNLHEMDINFDVNLHGLELSMERLALNCLIEWDRNPSRKPLMVYGARQVGKTYLIKELFKREEDAEF